MSEPCNALIQGSFSINRRYAALEVCISLEVLTGALAEGVSPPLRPSFCCACCCAASGVAPESSALDTVLRAVATSLKFIGCEAARSICAESKKHKYMIMIDYYILETCWEPPEAHWPCRQSVTAHRYITNFSCVCIPPEIGNPNTVLARKCMQQVVQNQIALGTFFCYKSLASSWHKLCSRNSEVARHIVIDWNG